MSATATAAAILGISEVTFALLAVLASFLVVAVAWWGARKVLDLFGVDQDYKNY